MENGDLAYAFVIPRSTKGLSYHLEASENLRDDWMEVTPERMGSEARGDLYGLPKQVAALGVVRNRSFPIDDKSKALY